VSALDARYAAWRATADGGKVVGYVLDKALRLRERGWRHYGVAALVEVARYDRALEVGPDADGLKINNSFRAYIAREVMAADDRLAGFFEVRRSAADVAGMETPPGYLHPDKVQARDMLVRSIERLEAEEYRPGLAPVTVEQVPIARRWRCVQPGCARVVTREGDPHLQPALGGYLSGQCPNLDCWSNSGPKRKDRGTSTFAPIREKESL
jgi:hypothetical protein